MTLLQNLAFNRILELSEEAQALLPSKVPVGGAIALPSDHIMTMRDKLYELNQWHTALLREENS